MMCAPKPYGLGRSADLHRGLRTQPLMIKRTHHFHENHNKMAQKVARKEVHRLLTSYNNDQQKEKQ